MRRRHLLLPAVFAVLTASGARAQEGAVPAPPPPAVPPAPIPVPPSIASPAAPAGPEAAPAPDKAAPAAPPPNAPAAPARAATAPPATGTAATAPAATATAPPAPATPPPADQPVPAPATAPAGAVAAAPSPSTVPAPPAAGAVPGPAAAPATAPDESDRAAHALERTLVERGGLLLAPGRFELVPQIGYAHSDEDQVLTPDGRVLPAQTRRVTGALTLRLGLPLDLQVEAMLPYELARQTAQDSAPATDSGIGDFQVLASWHAVRASGPGLDLLVNGFWKSRTGASQLDPEPSSVPLGSGIQQVGGGLSLVKTVDPVVLVAAASLGRSLPRFIAPGWIDAGYELAIDTSAILAVSPDTSLSFGLSQSYATRVKVASREIPGTDRTGAVFNVGFATLASRAGLVEITLGMGLTRDVPQFQVTLATPLQF
jgi:hypothetical protein